MTSKYKKALEEFTKKADIALIAGDSFWDEPNNEAIRQALELAIKLEKMYKQEV